MSHQNYTSFCFLSSFRFSFSMKPATITLHLKTDKPFRSRLIPGVVWTFRRHGLRGRNLKYTLMIEPDRNRAETFEDGLIFNDGVLEIKEPDFEGVEIMDEPITWYGIMRTLKVLNDDMPYIHSVTLSFSSIESFSLEE